MNSSPSIWHYVVSVKSTVKILSIFVTFIENMNFTNKNTTQYRCDHVTYYCNVKKKLFFLQLWYLSRDLSAFEFLNEIYSWMINHHTNAQLTMETQIKET